MVVPDQIPSATPTAEEHPDKDAQILALRARIVELEAALEFSHRDSAHSILTAALVQNARTRGMRDAIYEL
jgi:hypothetical protein